MYNRYKSKWWDWGRYFGPAVNENTVYEVVKSEGTPPLYAANNTAYVSTVYNTGNYSDCIRIIIL